MRYSHVIKRITPRVGTGLAGYSREATSHGIYTYDVYGDGKPTRIAHSDRDVRQPRGSLPVSEKIAAVSYSIPWFKRYRPRVIEEHASAFRKVAQNYQDLLADDPGNPEGMGGWGQVGSIKG